MIRHRWWLVVFGVSMAGAWGLDFVTKELALHYLAPRWHDPIRIIPGWLELTYVENDGGAWNIFAGKWYVFLLASVVAGLLVGWFVRSELRQCRPALLMGLGLGLLLGGVCGNLYDRLLRSQHAVIDMIDVAGSWYPVFNVADSAICVGVGLIFLLSWRQRCDGCVS